MSGMRRYGQWAGNPKGVAENPANCIKEVYPTERSMIPRQCTRKRGHGEGGLYCYQHSKSTQHIKPFRRD